MSVKTTHWALLTAVIAALLAPAVGAAAEMKFKVVSYITRFDVKPVGDVQGHFAGGWERRGLCFVNEEVGVYIGSGTMDATKGKGVGTGTSTCTFEDGSSFSTTYNMDTEPGPKGLALYKNGKGQFTGGTGRFEGIKGSTTFTGRAFTPFKDEFKSDVVMDSVGQYTVTKSS
jgi:hypothetical protein